MTDTAFKRTPLPQEFFEADPAQVQWPAELLSGAWARACRSADSALAGHRTLVCQHTGGPGKWLVLNSTPGGVAQAFPEYDVYRVVHRSRFMLSPGAGLEVRALAVPSGATEEFPIALAQWVFGGAGGQLRVAIDFENLDGDTDSVVVVWQVPTNDQEYGAENVQPGASWAGLRRFLATALRPAAAEGSLAEAAKWSEDTQVTITIEHAGGLRLIHCSVLEVPLEHVVADTRELVTAHTYPASLQHPDKIPLEESPDGATYEEHRHGTHRLLQASSRQSDRLGPIIAAWSPYAEDLAGVADTDIKPIAVTSTSLVGLSAGSSITAWAANVPGHDIAGGYARRAPENLSTRVSGAAAIPVRCRVWARFTGAGANTGVVRFQSTARSWVEVTVDQATIGTTWTYAEATGWLETNISADDTEAVLVDLASTTGDTMQVGPWCVEYGEVETP